MARLAICPLKRRRAFGSRAIAYFPLEVRAVVGSLAFRRRHFAPITGSLGHGGASRPTLHGFCNLKS